MVGNGLCKIRENIMIKKYSSLLMIVLITACGNSEVNHSNTNQIEEKTYNWRLVTAWPKKLSRSWNGP